MTIEKMPWNEVKEWLDLQPARRAALIAPLTSMDFSNDETIASKILGAFGDSDDVSSAFFGAYISGSWWGPASGHWLGHAERLLEVHKRTQLSKLKRWTAKSISSLVEMAAREREREEEEGMRRN